MSPFACPRLPSVPVCRQNILVGEGPAQGITTGGFQAALGHYSHPPWEAPVNSGTGGNRVVGPNDPSPSCVQNWDSVVFWLPIGTAAGTIEWNIPWWFSVGDGERKVFTHLLQTGDFDGTTMTVTKGGLREP